MLVDALPVPDLSETDIMTIVKVLLATHTSSQSWHRVINAGLFPILTKEKYTRNPNGKGQTELPW
jgi:hypothetical protein